MPCNLQLHTANCLSYKQLHEPNACGFHIRYEYDLIHEYDLSHEYDMIQEYWRKSKVRAKCMSS